MTKKFLILNVKLNLILQGYINCLHDCEFNVEIIPSHTIDYCD